MSKKLLLLLIPLFVASCADTKVSESLQESNKTSQEISNDISSNKDDSTESSFSNLSSEESSSETSTENSSTIDSSSSEESLKEKYDCIDIATAISLAGTSGDYTTPEKYYVYGVIKTVMNTTYGEMTIKDDTGEIYVYGIYDFSKMENQPIKGDEIVLYGNIQNKKGSPEIGKCDLIEFKHVKQDVSDEYEAKTIKETRNAPANSKVKITGVVAQKTYANDHTTPTGVYISDNTSSIYVYSRDVAANVNIGNTITVTGEKTYYVLDSEKTNAEKYNYIGSNQLQDATLIENDNQVKDFDTSWIEEKTIKEMMETPFNEDVTNQYFKVNALIKKSVQAGFVNYYFDDFDGITGSYAYTLASGADFTWLDIYDGKFCTLYLTAINAKSTATGCLYRFMPIKVISDSYTFDTTKIASFALEYYCDDQFANEYATDPSIECITSVNNDIIPFENVAITYSSNNDNVVYFESTADGKVVLHTKNDGTATITITATYGTQVASITKDITMSTQEAVDYITVKEAIDHELDQEVIVKGIVGPGIVNKQTGFHLIDETGVIPVILKNNDEFAKIKMGNEVIIKGTRCVYIKDGTTSKMFGQSEIYNAEVVTNLYGNNEYSTASFDNSKTIDDLIAFPITEEHTTQVYTLKTKIFRDATNYYVNYYIGSEKTKGKNISLYAGNGQTQLDSFLSNYDNQEVEMEVILCNYNSKTTYKAILLSITVDGVKIYNPINSLTN